MKTIVSIHARRATGDARAISSMILRPCFNSRPSCDGRPLLARTVRARRVSIHARRATGDLTTFTSQPGPFVFQFTPVVRRATDLASRASGEKKFQFTPVVRRATDVRADGAEGAGVSIHARRATGDSAQGESSSGLRRFNSRPSCDGRPRSVMLKSSRSSFNSRPSCDGRHVADALSNYRSQFQFTPVVRRATKVLKNTLIASMFQFTPVVRRATRGSEGSILSWRVSIHARRATGDLPYPVSDFAAKFQFTPVVRRATATLETPAHTDEFQFTPVVRRATMADYACILPWCFNSRPSCDGRQDCQARKCARQGFNSRPSCDGRRGAGGAGQFEAVSIHARRATGDKSLATCITIGWSFNSRPSCDGRPARPPRICSRVWFQFTPVVRRATARRLAPRLAIAFQFTPVVRRATSFCFSS